MGINPGGEVSLIEFPAGVPPNPNWVNRLVSRAELMGSWRQVQALPVAAVSALAHPVACPDNGRFHLMDAQCDHDSQEALAALADALAERPAEEILFDWFRSGRLVGELSVLIKRRHPDVQVEIDRVYQEHLAKLGKRRRDPAAQDD